MSIRTCCMEKHGQSQSPKSLKSHGRSSKAKSMQKVPLQININPRSQSFINMDDLNKKITLLSNIYACEDV